VVCIGKIALCNGQIIRMFGMLEKVQRISQSFNTTLDLLFWIFRELREALGNKVVKRSLRSDLFLMNVLGAD
jgi:ferric iron reductase protein FhuF